ncbi:hypothetical protein N7481_013201 [Penicillium waksmanii]|uniref:uncharacterized protein n=1 Tax=Penicillium waksmanii TaxID=69791 RepID=UPI0025479CA1|nr:uncharacterized protein N7481_013201 [Penicillium waksmanii]KAJ5966487.1 hypothetical protein N7481_013201 [Penicillium waksmanii]
MCVSSYPLNGVTLASFTEEHGSPPPDPVNLPLRKDDTLAILSSSRDTVKAPEGASLSREITAPKKITLEKTTALKGCPGDISSFKSSNQGNKRKRAEVSSLGASDKLSETVAENFASCMRQVPKIFEPMPSAATVMACPLPQIQHQGLQPNAEKLVYPIGYYGQIYDPDDISEVQNLYNDRLAVREQIDWECRRIGLRLMRLRELQALKGRRVDSGLSDGPSVSSITSSEKDDIYGSLWNWKNSDDDLLEQIRDLKLKSKEDDEGL